MKLTQTDELGALLAVLKVRHCLFKPQVVTVVSVFPVDTSGIRTAYLFTPRLALEYHILREKNKMFVFKHT